jgi:ABC-type phosphate transport system substrate-binding protein
MNHKQKTIVSMLILALLALSTAATFVKASGLPFQNGQLVNSNTLTIAGSSTVLPIATEEAGVWQTYWNNLVANNPGWGASQCTSPVTPVGQGSGTAIPALTAGTADVGEMSRPPNNATNEWLDFPPNVAGGTMGSMQIWAVGIDSVAIVLSPDMSWLPTSMTSQTGLTTSQVADLFASSPSVGGAAFTTWGDFFTREGIANTATSAELSGTIQRAVRDPTSGTFDCFNNYFAVPNNFQFEHKTSGVVDNSQNMAPYTLDTANIDIYNSVHNGNNYIGFISLGYLQSYGGMVGLNISYNIANLPSSTIAVSNPPVWGPYVAPSRDNVIYALSNYKDTAATGQYFAWRWLWEVTPSTIPSSGQLLETGVWIAYMKEGNTTVAGTSDFVNDQSYIELDRDDMSGGAVLNGALGVQTPSLAPGQTQSIPDGKVNFHDLSYFVSAYIAYSNGVYNPYADMNADGKINFNDLKLFVSTYIAYFTTYVP